jgi:ABC-type lipoprotein release transport system permease subunit
VVRWWDSIAVMRRLCRALTILGVVCLFVGVGSWPLKEIGVRMALGAQRQQVLWLVLKRSLLQLAIGLPIGIAGALGVGQLLKTVLAQTSTRDVATLASISGLMIAVSVAACFWPARRATRLDPVSCAMSESSSSEGP